MWLWLLGAVIPFICMLLFLGHKIFRKGNACNCKGEHGWNYDHLRRMIKTANVSLPAGFVNMDVFDANAKIVIEIARSNGKNFRVATKSIRCLTLIKRISDLAGNVVISYMCYSTREAKLLASEGLDDFFVPYPTFQMADVEMALELLEKGKTITLTIDSITHVKLLSDICSKIKRANENGHVSCEGTKLRVAIDLDLSWKLLGGWICLGPHRSRVDSVDKFARIAESVARSRHLTLVGTIGYEGHVAGLPDDNPFSRIPNVVIRFLKVLFYKRTVNLRHDVAKYCKNHGIALEFFNGGGSGNIRDVAMDPSVSEVTAGSVFLQAQLFDYFIKKECKPAFVFALQVTRVNPGYICCQSGGFIASGTTSQDKNPIPYSNPIFLKHYADEGYGEVQTPLQILGTDNDKVGIIEVGDPVIFRPAKSGEIAEHFNDYILLRQYNIVERAKTYRGLGYVFY